MSFRAWLALLSFYLLYLLVGGYIFHTLEMPNDCKNIQERYKKSQKLNKIVQRIQNDNLTDFQKNNITELLKEINEQFRLDNSGVHISDLDSSIPPNCTHVELKWNFASSLLFAFTSITTIGYGQLAPDTILGKLICLVYCLLGVPINAFLITSIGTYFQGKLKKFMSRWSRGSETKVFVMKIIFQVLIYLILGPLLFILVPALVLIHIEVEWSYVEAIYFSFITLTTIGFGDLVPGKSLETLNRLGNWEYVYLAGILIWGIFGLGYFSLIMSAMQNLICVKIFNESQEENVDSENIVTPPGQNELHRSDSKDHIGPLDNGSIGFNNPNVLDDPICLDGPNGPNGLNGPNGMDGPDDVNGMNSLNGQNNYDTWYGDIEAINPNPNVVHS